MRIGKKVPDVDMRIIIHYECPYYGNTQQNQTEVQSSHLSD